MALIVTAPLVIAKNENGSDRYLYRGAPVPDGQDPAWVDRMINGGLIGDAAKADDKPADDKPARKTTKAAKADDKPADDKPEE